MSQDVRGMEGRNLYFDGIMSWVFAACLAESDSQSSGWEMMAKVRLMLTSVRS